MAKAIAKAEPVIEDIVVDNTAVITFDDGASVVDFWFLLARRCQPDLRLFVSVSMH